ASVAGGKRSACKNTLADRCDPTVTCSVPGAARATATVTGGRGVHTGSGVGVSVRVGVGVGVRVGVGVAVAVGVAVRVAVSVSVDGEVVRVGVAVRVAVRVAVGVALVGVGVGLAVRQGTRYASRLTCFSREEKPIALACGQNALGARSYSMLSTALPAVTNGVSSPHSPYSKHSSFMIQSK